MSSGYLIEAKTAYESGLYNFYLLIKNGFYLFPENGWNNAQPRSIKPKKESMRTIEMTGFPETGKSEVLKKLALMYPGKINIVPEFFGIPPVKLDFVPDRKGYFGPQPSILSVLSNLAQKLSVTKSLSTTTQTEEVTIIERGPVDAIIDFFMILMYLERINQLVTYLDPLAVGFLNAVPLLEKLDGLCIIETTDYQIIKSRRKQQGKSEGIYSSEEYFKLHQTALSCAMGVWFRVAPYAGSIFLDSTRPIRNNVRRIARFIDLER